jgi:phospholipid transport system substrate-binding protein
MKSKILRSIAFWLMCMLPFSLLAEQQAMQPDEMTRRTVDDVLVLLQKNNAVYKSDRSKFFSMVDKKLLPYFDFRKMSQLVLGKNWRTATDAQKEAFVADFKDLLVRTYAVAMLKFTDQKMVYLPYTGKPSDRTVVVKLKIKQSGGAGDIPVYTTFYNGKNGWKVIDITIEGISMVTNYRNVYNQTIREQGLDALIKSLADANARARKVKSG